jgi:hypothetical protein
MRQNLHQTQKMRQWLKDNDIGFGFQIVGFHDTYVSNLDTEKRVDFGPKEKKALVRFLKAESKPKSLADTRAYYWRDLLAMYRDKKRRTTPCPFLKDQFALDSFGNVFTCFSSKAIGNIRKEGRSASQIYFDPGNVAYRKKMWQRDCVKCNSGCNVNEAIAYDAKSYLWFWLTGKPWYGLKSLLSL